MPRPRTRPAGTLRLPVALLLAGAVLAGCTPDRQPAGPVLPGPSPAPPTTQSLAAQCGSRPFGAADAEDPGWVQFYVTPQQMEVISSRLLEVLCRQGLWRQGVGFGTNVDQDGKRFVMIHPGRSGLTARQVLDRFLGRVP
jgi:hypothetical protein